MTTMTYIIQDEEFEFETCGYEFLKTLPKKQLVDALRDPEAHYERETKEDLISRLIREEDLFELFGEDMKDFYYQKAEQDYEEMKQWEKDESSVWYRDRM
jgi:hypothetical protein